MDVFEALATRRSIRAFRPDPVPRAVVERILDAAAQAPSGSNIQPWRVIVLSGAARERLCSALLEAHARGERPEPDWHYYPRTWREPWLSRRRRLGWALYGLLGIQRGDTARMAAQHARNFTFFDAPVGLIFTLSHDLERGSWLDAGMFLQSVMLAARGLGLHTCPQAAFNEHHDVVRRVLGIPASETILCGMALGHADETAPVNDLRAERVRASTFAEFRDG
jgi:nitroreductase